MATPSRSGRRSSVARKTRKRRKLLDRKDRKARTLARLVDVFAERGFAGTTTAALAKASGVSEALLYKLFPNKRAMYREMIRATLAQVGGDLREVEPPAPKDDVGYFTGLARMLLTQTKENTSFVRLLYYSQLQDDAFAAEFRQAHGQGALPQIEAYIRKRIDDGDFRAVHPALAAWAFMSMVWQYALDAFVFQPRYSPRVDDELTIATFVDIFLSGLRTT